MPPVRLALAVSAIAHAGVLIGLGLARSDDVELVADVSADDVPALEIVPIDVALVPANDALQSVRSTPTAGATTTSTRAPAFRMATATAGPTSAIATTAPGSGTEAGRGYLRMRGVDLALPANVADELAAGGQAAPPVAISGKLKPRGGGTAEIRDKVATIDVHRDGTVTMHSAPDFEIHFKLPRLSLSKLRQQIGESIDDWYKDAYAQARATSMQELPRHQQAVPGGCDHYFDLCYMPGDEAASPPEDDEPAGLFFIYGRADITSWLAHKTGVGDVYSARKRKLLDDTRDERISRGGAFRAEQLDRSAELMRRNLERLWSSTIDPAARRRALFELWDECGEGDGPLGEAGERARGQVIGWIASHLPAGSAGAFTADEITAFNARRSSRQRFAPE